MVVEQNEIRRHYWRREPWLDILTELVRGMVSQQRPVRLLLAGLLELAAPMMLHVSRSPHQQPDIILQSITVQPGPVVLIKVAKAEPVRLILRQPRRRHAGLGVLCQGHVRFSVERVEAESAGGVLQLQHVDAADIDGGLGQVCVIVTATAVLVGAALSGTRLLPLLLQLRRQRTPNDALLCWFRIGFLLGRRLAALYLRPYALPVSPAKLSQ
mmetsp:Transcript_49243/g.82621  ORF Transcript_49243/g.82621 Transcript_49243/m.82621 type:complete len:213 (-) Transcript_49243:247-885(-)